MQDERGNEFFKKLCSILNCPCYVNHSNSFELRLRQ
jgi:hypothetical protein